MKKSLMDIFGTVCLAVFSLGTVPAVADATSDAVGSASSQNSRNIVQIAEADPDLSTLVKAVADAGLVKTLTSAGPFTVFAPTNEAFAKLPAGLLDYLLANPSILQQVLLYHVAGGQGVLTGNPLQTVQGENVFATLDVTPAGLSVKVNNSRLSITPIVASNGVIYIIDSVLLPQFR